MIVQIDLQISKNQAKMGILGDLDVPTFYLLTRTDQTSISTNTIKVTVMLEMLLLQQSQ